MNGLAGNVKLKAPFPAFGGKSRIAPEVWKRLGSPSNFIEPFFNSGAVLLARPDKPQIETINDIDCYIANFWRSVQRDPEAVVAHCDYPVSELDLHARHRWLVTSEHAAKFREQMRTDPDHFDAKVAGWWVWGACCWIGGGWCANPEWTGRPPESDARGVHSGRERAHRGKGGPAGGSGNRNVLLGGGEGQVGHGIHAKGQVPDISGDSGAAGRGIHAGAGHTKKRPDLTGRSERDRGSGVHKIDAEALREGRPQLADQYDVGRGVHAGKGLGTCAQRRAWLLDWFARLQDRLRLVRVCCGHWLRVCDSPSVTTRLGITAVFLDPPYALDLERMLAWVAHLLGKGPKPGPRKKGKNRDDSIYTTDGDDVDRLVAEVHLYCRERGSDPKMRLALCGYQGEHDSLEELGWEVHAWETQGGYANQAKENNGNAKRERIWFSPHCQRDKMLF